MNIQYNGLYNEDFKERFLAERYESENSRVKYRTDFYQFAKYENENGKDLYDFTPNELQDMFAGGFGAKTLASLLTKRSTLVEYLLWAREEGYGTGIVDIKNIITRDDLRGYVSKIAKENRYISEEELKDLCQNKIVNAQDAVVLALLFSGVLGEEAYDIVNLKISDCDFENNTIMLNREPKPYKLEQWVMDLIQEAIDQDKYQKENGDPESVLRATETSIFKTNYVIRYAVGRKYLHDNSVYPWKNIQKRTKDITMKLGYDYLTPYTIFKSGMFNELQKIESIKSLTIQDFKDVITKFGLKENKYYDYKQEYEYLYGKK